MKNLKKKLSVILASSMVLPTFSVFAEDSTSSLEETKTRVYIVDQQFETAGDTEGWVFAPTQDDLYDATVEQTEKDGYGVLKIKAHDDMEAVITNASAAHFDMPEDITFKDGAKIHISTRFYHETDTSSTNSRVSLKYNRPFEIADRDSADASYNLGVLFMEHTGKLMYKSGTSAAGNTIQDSMGTLMTEAANKWIDVEMTLDFANNKGTFSAKETGSTEPAITSTGNLTTKNPSEALESLAILFRGTPSSIYLDYLNVWESYEGKMKVNASYAPGEKIEVDLNIPLDKAFITAEDALSLYDDEGNVIKAQITADEENNKIVIVPEDDIIEGDYYAVKIDESKVAPDCTFEILEKQFYASYTDYIIYDDFDNGKLGGWKLGENSVSADSYEYGVKDGVMYLNLLSACNQNVAGRPYLISDFDDVLYEQGKNIVIKARVKTTDHGKHRIPLKVNRPDDATLDVKNLNSHWYTIGEIRGDYYANGNGSSVGNLVTVTPQTWIDVEIKYNGIDNSGTTKVTCNGTTTSKATKVNLQDAALAAAGATGGFEEFKSLSFLPVNWDGTSGNFGIEVDYIYAYEEVTVTTEIEKKTVYNNENIIVKLDKAIKNLPDGAVTLKNASGVAVEGLNVIYNNDTKEISINSEEKLTEGKYTLELNNSVIEGVEFTTKKFEVYVVNTGVKGIVLNQQFNEEGNTEGWVFAPTKDDLFDATVEQTEKDGYGVLKITAHKDMASVVNDASSAHFDMPEEIVFKDGAKIRIKTRFYHETDTESTNTRVSLKYNRPFAIAERTTNEAVCNFGVLFMEHTGNLFVKEDYILSNGAWQDSSHKLTEGGMANKWVDIEAELDFANNIVNFFVKETGSTEPALTATGNLTTRNPSDALESLAILFRGDPSTIYVDYMIIEEFAEDEVFATLKVNGEKATVISAGDKVIPEFTVNPGANEQKSYVAISAMYVNGVLSEVHTKPITTTGTVYIEEDGYIVPDEGDVVIKAFIWDSMSTMKPVGKNAEVGNQLKIYVDDNGSDTFGTGELASPVASLSKALEIAGGVDQESTDAVEILVGGGTYYLKQPVKIKSADNVTGKLIIKAKSGEKPTFINGITFKLADAEKVTDSNITSRLAEQTAVNSLYALDLTTKVELKDIPKLSLPGAYNVSWAEETKTPTCEMFFNGSPMIIARYPNSGYETITNVVNEGAIPRYWENDKINTDEYVEEEHRNKNDVFIISSDRADKWRNADQALMFGYWKYNWATQTVPLLKAENNTLTAKYPSYYGVDVGQRYYVYNLLEEIDMPGEYFIDRTTGIMYFCMPEKALENDEIIMSLNTGNMISISASDTVIDGLTFTASRGKALSVNADNVTVKNCEISNTADVAVEVLGNNNVVENCFIHDVNGGIYLIGGNSSDFTEGNSRIINNEISNFARLNKVYTYAVQVSGFNNIVSNNEIHNAEHTAITFSGGNHEISYNDIHDVCKDVDDAGAIYVGRSWISRGNKITNNYIHDIKSEVEQENPVAGVFIDDHFAGLHIEGNVFANIVGHGVRTNKGRENTITNNIFVNCSLGGAYISATSNPKESSYVTHINAVKKYLGDEAWMSKYPMLFTKDSDGNPAVNVQELIYGNDNVCTNNLSVKSGNGVAVDLYARINGTVSGNVLLNSDPGFADMENGDYSINEADVKKHIQGFKNIEFEKMGRR